ncbi:uncharacterized protein [Temnothorax nylanderi]|uniref:uncharacterized protein n=1 Tax=Temnothorax nylanderi TaxID=102681 RepID=UPI003A85CDA7
MGRLRCFDITSIAFIGMLFFAGVAEEATGQDAITSLESNVLDLIGTNSEYNMKAYDNGCKCIKHNCGCCKRLEWDAISMDGKLCINATYLENDYGVSLTVTYNNFTVYNETVSARNPPPICFGEDIVDALDVEVCLRIYDINYKSDDFHACFEITGRIMKLTISKIKLGCIQAELRKKIEYIENKLSPFKMTEDTLLNVVMV